MSAFTYELATLHEAIKKAHPNHPEGIYAVPMYLVVGLPGSGRSTALHAMHLTWKDGDGPLRTGLPTQLCTYWLPQEGAFIEPESTVLGTSRVPEHLKQLCEELKVARPREHLDGIILVVNIADFIDLDERATDDYAHELRRYLVEIQQALQADIPTYVLLTRYDTVWGFAEVFQWGPDRAKEDPWGFQMPPDLPTSEALPRFNQELEGLNARLEAFCLARLCSEDPPEQRIRGFQHLAEVRALMEKLRAVFKLVAMANAYERAPWIRALAIGSALPGGGGGKLRAGVSRFFNMGLSQGPANPVTNRPGGLPIHAYMANVILQERDIVPLRVRWRDDKLFVVAAVIAGVLWLATVITAVVFSVQAKGHEHHAGAHTHQKK